MYQNIYEQGGGQGGWGGPPQLPPGVGAPFLAHQTPVLPNLSFGPPVGALPGQWFGPAPGYGQLPVNYPGAQAYGQMQAIYGQAQPLAQGQGLGLPEPYGQQHPEARRNRWSNQPPPPPPQQQQAAADRSRRRFTEAPADRGSGAPRHLPSSLAAPNRHDNPVTSSSAAAPAAPIQNSGGRYGVRNGLEWGRGRHHMEAAALADVGRDAAVHPDSTAAAATGDGSNAVAGGPGKRKADQGPLGQALWDDEDNAVNQANGNGDAWAGLQGGLNHRHAATAAHEDAAAAAAAGGAAAAAASVGHVIPMPPICMQPPPHPSSPSTAAAAASSAAPAAAAPSHAGGGGGGGGGGAGGGSPEGYVYDVLGRNIRQLVTQLSPSEQEHRKKEMVLQLVRQAAAAAFPERAAVLRAEPFGSYVSGLGTCSSDIDVVLVGLAEPSLGLGFYSREERPRIARLLDRLTPHLRSRLHLTKLLPIRHARVPILKLATAGGVNVDVSIAGVSGPRAAEYLRQQVSAYPPLRPLVLVLKSFLRSEGLGEVASGGLSSYGLTYMTLAHLMEEAKRGSDPTDLGALLHSLLRRFGRRFDCGRMAVSVRHGGLVPKAALAGGSHVEHPDRIVTIDPLTGRNCTEGCFRSREVLDAMARADAYLTAWAVRQKDEVPYDADILGPLVRAVG
ncbi:hypothetical protein Agub_g15630, partial [Astrephomene gubernaculifera]